MQSIGTGRGIRIPWEKATARSQAQSSVNSVDAAVKSFLLVACFTRGAHQHSHTIGIF